MGGQTRIGKCGNLAFISFTHLLNLFIYCIYLIVIQLFYIYAFHSDCISSHIIEQMLPLCMYRQTMPSNFICKGLRNATYRFLFI